MMDEAEKTVYDPSVPSSTTHAMFNQARGAIYSTIGSVTGLKSWTDSGSELQKLADKERDQVSRELKLEARHDHIVGGLKSGWGMLTGDQDEQSKGNSQVSSGDWKRSAADGTLTEFSGLEKIKGKVQSAVGILTQDQDEQTEGNLRAVKND